MRNRKLMAVVLGALVAVVAPAGADEVKPKGGARIAVEPAGGFDFGKALQNKTLDKEFTIKNFGSEELVIDNVTTSCGCTIAQGYSKNVKPGASTTMRVTFSTGQNRGHVVKNILIQSNDPENAKINLKIEAEISPEPSPEPK